ncbi:helix-turn-helix domain-containing protein [Chitinophaga silvatica]|uniref:Helix-turn-helix domain-containing protein n=1 Tax=Chitinophaga silvatica TaxID=2282649 RepID=A0A3E1YB18_9BACT|nr:helix-turn-helix domain-containing protein [Chitinophaga silvatica]RFS23246.1 helix-turn-helix domain-containing protein [Chitinophaga silvatica]
MLINKHIDIPYQNLPEESQFGVLPLSAFKGEFSNLPHRHDYFQIIWFIKAKGRHMVDFEWYDVEDNMIFFLRPGQVHQVDCESSGYSIYFTEQFYFTNRQDKETLFDFTTLFDTWKGYNPITITSSNSNSLIGLIDLMIREKENLDYHCFAILKHYLSAFLLLTEKEKMHRDANYMPSSAYDARVVQLRRLLEQHFRAEHQVIFYANSFSLTPKRLNEITKDCTGRTVTELLHDRITLEAKRQLSFSRKSIKEICYELGFEDPAYFSRFFKNNTALSPQEFRDMMFK